LNIVFWIACTLRNSTSGAWGWNPHAKDEGINMQFSDADTLCAVLALPADTPTAPRNT